MPKKPRHKNRRSGGRPRSGGPREANGRLARRDAEIIPPEVIAKRRKACGGSGGALSSFGGYALGQLLLAGVITQGQHNAGLEYGHQWRLYLASTGAPRPTAKATTAADDTPHGPIDLPDGEARARRWLDAANGEIRACTAAALTMEAVRMVCCDNVAPDGLVTGQRPTGAQAIRRGLDAVIRAHGMRRAA